VEDAAAAYMLLAEGFSLRPDLRGEALNISTEQPLTALEMVQKIIALMGKKLEPDIRNEATHEIPAQHLSAGKARRIIGWSPLFTLEEGLRRTIAWYEQFLRT